MQGKVEICGINTARLEILKNDEMMELLRRTKQGDMAARERNILALRFCQGKTQMEVSSEIGISQAQVSRLEKNAIRSIKQEL